MSGFGKEMGSRQAILRQLIVSATMSLAMLLATLGFRAFSSNPDLPSTAVLILVFAVSFIVAAVLIDRASDDLPASFMAGAAVALGVTIFVGALILGVSSLVNGAKPLPGLETLVIGFAVCLVASLVVNRLTLKI